MIEQYNVRVLRPWAPGLKRGDTVKVSGRRRHALIKMNMVVDVAEAEPVLDASVSEVNPAAKKAAKKRGRPPKKQAD